MSNSAVALLDKLQLAADEIDDARSKIKTFKVLIKVAQKLQQPEMIIRLFAKIRTDTEDIKNARFKAYEAPS